MQWWKMFSLKGKTALITGGSRGIGRATAELFAEAGAQVIVSSRNRADLDTVAAGIRERGGHAHAIPAHMGKIEEVENLIAELERRGLTVDVLVNNGAISPLLKGTFCDTTLEYWEKVLEVNLTGPFVLSTRLGRAMAERGGGAIVNVSSTTAYHTTPLLGSYCVSKAGLNTLAQVLAKEFGPQGVRVNTIACGLVETAMGDWTIKNEKSYAFMMQHTPLARHGLPKEIASVALFLASGAASFTTGATLFVDGGVSA
jgi:NAD(P)-dependent dehydrogenase (short-subunit alcohol dehydrogenase family)